MCCCTPVIITLTTVGYFVFSRNGSSISLVNVSFFFLLLLKRCSSYYSSDMRVESFFFFSIHMFSLNAR